MILAHVPAGYLLSRALVSSSSSQHKWRWIALGTAGAILPDLDLVYTLGSGEKVHHHDLFTHRPLFWLVITVISLVSLWFYRSKRKISRRPMDMLRSFPGIILANVWLHLLLDSPLGKIHWSSLSAKGSAWLEVPTLFLPKESVVGPLRGWHLNFAFHWYILLEVLIVIAALWSLSRDLRSEPNGDAPVLESSGLPWLKPLIGRLALLVSIMIASLVVVAGLLIVCLPQLDDWAAYKVYTKVPLEPEWVNRCPASKKEWGQKNLKQMKRRLVGKAAGVTIEEISLPGGPWWRTGTLRSFRFSGDAMKWSVLLQRPPDRAFTLNASFHDKEHGEALGLLISEGQVIQKPDGGKGVFLISKDGPKVALKAKSLRKLEGGFQAREMPLRRGRFWGNGRRHLNSKSNGAHRTYRSLLGQAKNGDLIVVVSEAGGLVTIPEIACVGRALGAYNAMLPDGGVSLDYSARIADQNYGYQALPWPFYSLAGHSPQTSWISAQVR